MKIIKKKNDNNDNKNNTTIRSVNHNRDTNHLLIRNRRTTITPDQHVIFFKIFPMIQMLLFGLLENSKYSQLYL